MSIKSFWGRDEGMCPAAVGLEGSLERTSTGKILVSALLGKRFYVPDKLSPLPDSAVRGQVIIKAPLRSGPGYRAWNEPGDSAGRGFKFSLNW